MDTAEAQILSGCKCFSKGRFSSCPLDCLELVTSEIATSPIQNIKLLKFVISNTNSSS